MLQVGITALDSRGLYVPTTLEKVVVNFKKHEEFVKNFEDGLIPVQMVGKTKTM